MWLRHRRRRRDGHERLGLLVGASCDFPVDAVGVVGCREDNSEEDEKYCEPAFQLPDTLVLVAAVLAVWPGERRRREREERYAAKRTFAKKKGKTQMWITIIVVVCTVATRAEIVSP